MFPNQDSNQPGPSAPQQANNGQYEVVPPPAPNTMRPSGHNPYEFIVTPNQKNRSRFTLLGGNSFLKQIILIVGGAIILMIIAAVVISMAFPGNSHKADLTTIAQEQQELVRVATEGASQATGQATKNLAMTVELGVGSSQQQIISYLADHGTKLGSKTLGGTQSSQTDTTLEEAQASSTYDQVLVRTLTDQLNAYQASLKQAYTNSKDAALQQLLNQNYQAAGLLLQQAKAASS